MDLTKRIAIAGLSLGLYSSGCRTQQSTNTGSNSSVDPVLLSQIDECLDTLLSEGFSDLPVVVGSCTALSTYNFPELVTGDGRGASYTVCNSKKILYGWNSEELETCIDWVDVVYTLCDTVVPSGEICPL